MEGQGQRENGSPTGRSNLSPNCPPAPLGNEARDELWYLRGAMKIAPLRQSQAQRWGISKSKEANQGSESGSKRWRGKWNQVTELSLGWEASDRSRRGCVLQLHHDSAHRMQLILQEEGSEVSGKTFLIGF